MVKLTIRVKLTKGQVDHKGQTYHKGQVDHKDQVDRKSQVDFKINWTINIKWAIMIKLTLKIVWTIKINKIMKINLTIRINKIKGQVDHKYQAHNFNQFVHWPYTVKPDDNTYHQCLGSGSGSVGSPRFWLPGSGSAKICGSTDPDPKGKKTTKNFF